MRDRCKVVWERRRLWWPLQGAGKSDSQRRIHLHKRLLRLLEEAKDYALAEFPFVFIVVHFEDLFKGCRVDAITMIREAGGSAI